MDTIKDIATAVGLLAALWGLYKGIFEFALQGKQKRAEIFLKKQGEYFGNRSFNEIRELLEHDDPKLKTIGFEEKRAYLTFFEEIALLRNSGLINGDLAYYMFGYYATKCLESENFWSNILKEDIFWNVFLRFATEMQTRLRKNGEGSRMQSSFKTRVQRATLPEHVPRQMVRLHLSWWQCAVGSPLRPPRRCGAPLIF